MLSFSNSRDLFWAALDRVAYSLALLRLICSFSSWLYIVGRPLLRGNIPSSVSSFTFCLYISRRRALYSGLAARRLFFVPGNILYFVVSIVHMQYVFE